MNNESGLVPLGRTVLVQPYEPERKKGLIAIPDSVSERSVMIEQRVVVIATGPDCWTDESTPRAKPGDKVLVSKMAGAMAKGTMDGKQYRLVNDRDIFCRIDQEA